MHSSVHALTADSKLLRNSSFAWLGIYHNEFACINAQIHCDAFLCLALLADSKLLRNFSFAWLGIYHNEFVCINAQIHCDAFLCHYAQKIRLSGACRTQTSGTDRFQILLLLVVSRPYSLESCTLRLAPSWVTGVAVASQVLCTSTTLNKRTLVVMDYIARPLSNNNLKPKEKQ